MRLWIAPILALLAVLAGAPAAAEPRIALVIGNARYVGRLDPLGNPVRDATAISTALRAAGFDVEMVSDADNSTMLGALDRFRDRIARAGADATALFYYAGHGMQASEINYLAPVNTRLLERDAVAADTVLERMEGGGAATKIMILDACRNAPVVPAVNAGRQGFEAINVINRGRGFFIAYSTAAGQTASDGDGDHSPFAAAFARELVVPGQSLITSLIRVRVAVVDATGGRQTPWDANSLMRDVVFVAGDVSNSRPPAMASADPGLTRRGGIEVDFNAVPTVGVDSRMVAAAPFLLESPARISLRDVTPRESQVAFVNNMYTYEGRYAAPTRSQNMLTQVNTGNGAASFTLVLSRPAHRIRFMIPRLFPDTSGSGVSSPAWRATALGEGGQELDSRSRPGQVQFDVDIDSEIVTLEGWSRQPIVAVRFESDPRRGGVLFSTDPEDAGTPFAATSALLIEGLWIEPAE